MKGILVRESKEKFNNYADGQEKHYLNVIWGKNKLYCFFCSPTCRVELPGLGRCSGHNEKNLLCMSQFPYVVSGTRCAWW